jgi:hypothetical protein
VHLAYTVGNLPPLPPSSQNIALRSALKCRLLADCVEKLENRRAPKISQMLRIGYFSRCKAL